MASGTTLVLCGTAAALGFGHTLVGVDHTLPFVLLGRAQRWRLGKLWSVTALCGLAHVLSSVAIALVGIALGVALGRLEWIERTRGAYAAWLLVGLGLAYAIWGAYRARRRRPHGHLHAHDDGTVHDHDHAHHGEHSHGHVPEGARVATVMGLLVVFVLGPCEVLIPLLMAPSVQHGWFAVAAVACSFGVVTVATMLALVTVGHFGLKWRGFARVERHLHTVSGAAIAASGLCIILLGV